MTRKGLFIGVDTYRNLTSLSCAVADARAMGDFFANRAGYATETLENPRYPDVVTARVRAAREGLEAGDLLLVFFAGHGVVSQELTPRLLCADAHPDSVLRDAGAIKFVEWQEAVRGPQDTVILIDACQEDLAREGADARAAAAEKDREIEALKRQLAALQAQGVRPRGMFGSLFRRRDLSFADETAAAAEKPAEAGGAARGGVRSGRLAVLHSCGAGAFSYESGGHGLFTQSFLAEAGEAADAGLSVRVGDALWRRINARMGRLAAELEENLRRRGVPDAGIVQEAQLIPSMTPIEILPGRADARDAEPAAAAPAAEAREGHPFSATLPGGAPLPMAWCPATTSGAWRGGEDSFAMGSPPDEPGRRFLERDDGAMSEWRHRVRLTHGFWIGETPVTQRQWRAVMGTTVSGQCGKAMEDPTPYEWPGSSRVEPFREHKGAGGALDMGEMCPNEGPDAPVYYVCWEEASEFCRRLTEAERGTGRLPKGFAYRLPTEAEWEYACRAGTSTTLPNEAPFSPMNGGMDAQGLRSIAWYGGTSYVGWEGRGLSPSRYGREPGNPNWRMAPRDVHGKEPNRWGVKDMLGNVWEWCLDFAAPYPFADLAEDPAGPATGRYRIVRGGCWLSDAPECRPAARWRHEPGFRNWTVGFRVVLGQDAGGRR